MNALVHQCQVETGGGTGLLGSAPLFSPPIPTPLPSDHWYSEMFRYIFRAVALKKVAHHPDGVLWPRQHPARGGDSSSRM
jgi:hypothetical protein